MAERDYSALTEPVAKADVVAFHNSVKRRGGYNEWSRSTQAAVLVFAGVMIIVPVIVVSVLVAQVQKESAGPTLVIWTISASVAAILAIAFGVQLIREELGALDRREDWFRFVRFAADNSLGYAPRAKNTHGFRGLFFRPGTATLVDRFIIDDDTEYGNVRRDKPRSKNDSAGEYHYGGYLAVRLDRILPRMLLESRENSRFRTSLSFDIDREQLLELEGDFGDHFALYAPAGYERDALYVFTPDLMAVLIDEAADFDLEIADGWMFAYPAKPFDLRDPTLHEVLADIAAVVGPHASRRSSRYRDERFGSFAANAVTPHGRRLKRGRVSPLSVLAGVVTSVLLIAPPIASAIFDWR